MWLVNNNNNNCICIAPLKTEFTKCFDRQSKKQAPQKTILQHKTEQEGQTKARQDHGNYLALSN